MTPLRLISVCAGIGGIDVGFERAGMQTVAQIEIDDYAQKILTKHWPDVPKFRDIRSVSAWTLPHCDVLAGGIPCQPHSLAGRRQAGADDRDLWPEFYRLICELRPSYAVVENVPGLRSSDDGRFFGRILRDLATAGYDAEWVDLSAAAVGAPHIRERVWIVAYTNGGQRRPGRQPARWQARPDADRGGDWPAMAHAHAHGQRCEEQHVSALTGAASQSDWLAAAGDVAHAQCPCDRPEARDQARGPGAGRSAGWPGGSSWWQAEPAVGRVAHGIPHRLDQLRGLGNAVVPACAEVIGRLIVQHWENSV